MKRCPKCGSPLEGPNGKHYYFCSNDQCTVFSVKYDNRFGGIKQVLTTGITSIEEEIHRAHGGM